MFDSINLKQAISGVYEAGLKDDNLSLVYEAHREIFMAVNTPYGLSERQTLKNIVLQCDTWGWTLLGQGVFGTGELRHPSCANLGTCVLRFADFCTYKM